MARGDVGQIGQPRITPIASPVDSFARTNEGASLQALAEGLSTIAPELRRFNQIRIAEQKQEGELAGTSLFEEVQRTGQRIKAGEIAAHESKWFRLAAREQYGRLSAVKFAGDLQAAILQDASLAESTSPEDFDRFEGEFRKTWLTENVGEDSDPAFDAGFGNRASELMLNQRNSWIAQAGQRLEAGVIEATYQEHQNTVAELGTRGASWEEIGKILADRNAALLVANPKSGKALQQTTLKAVIDMAIAERRTEVLDILMHIPGGTPGSVIGKTSGARAAVEEAKRQIRADRMSENNLAAQEDRIAANDAVDTVFDSFYDALDNAGKDNLSSVDVTEFARQLQQNPLVKQEDIQRLYSAYNAYAKASDKDDQPVADGLWSKAFTGGLRSVDVSEAFEEGSITIETARRLRQEIGEGRRGRKAQALIAEPAFNEAQSALRQLFIDQYGVNKFEAKWRADQAVWQLKRDWIAFRRSPEGAAMAGDEEKLNAWLQNANRRNFINFADADTRSKLKGLPNAELTSGVGPTPVDWQTGAVIPSHSVSQLQAEVDAVRNKTRARFSPAAAEVLRRNGINNLEEAQTFLERQREFIPFGQLDAIQ